MITCLGDMFFPEVGVAMVKLLRRHGVTVQFPERQTCCGMPLFNSGYHADAAAVAARTRELSQFLVEVVGVESVGSSFTGKVTYHDSCHLLRGLGESRCPRALLRGVRGVELVELPGADECCGFGGSFSVRLPEVSTAILGRKLDNVERTGADCVVACDAGCLMQIGGGLSRRRSRVRALHLAQILAGEEKA